MGGYLEDGLPLGETLPGAMLVGGYTVVQALLIGVILLGPNKTLKVRFWVIQSQAEAKELKF